MTFSNKYSLLFRVSILNLFYLNKGLSEFNSMSEPEKDIQIDSYQINNYFKINPTAETSRIISSRKLMHKSLGTDLSVLVKATGSGFNTPFIPLQPDLSLTFLIQLADPRFYNYTDLKLSNSGKLYYFSNRRLSTEVGTFPLINLFADTKSIDENFVLNAASTTSELEQLSSVEKDGLFGIIRVFMRGDDSTHHVVDSINQIPSPQQNFKLQLNNRKSFWRYIFRQDQTVPGSDDVEIEDADPKILITKAEQPLTEKGFIAIDHNGTDLPNPNANNIKPDSSGTKFYSEIYM
jgi:hypothetical protein